MYKRLFNLSICFVLILGSLFITGGQQKVIAESLTLDEVAGISAWYQSTDPLTLSEIKDLFFTIEIETTNYIIGKIALPLYDSVYYPYVFVGSNGTIMAFYLDEDPAAKMIDVIGQTLETTLLEQALEIIAGSDVSVSYYDFRYPAATNMLLVAEDKDLDNVDNYFTLNMPVENNYLERSYGFFQNYYPIFRLNTVNFVTTNDLYTGLFKTGSIYGTLDAEELSPGLDNLFIVDSFDAPEVVGFGAILVTYSVSDNPGGNFIIEFADFSNEIPLIENNTLDSIDVFPGGFDKYTATYEDVNHTLNWTLEWDNSTAPNYEYCVTDEVDELLAPICNNWISAGSESSVDISVPLFNQTYYWQVRAFNDFGIVSADDGLWGEFTTGDPVAPDPFVKVSPSNGTEISPTAVMLDWDPSPYGAYSYEYCVSTEFDTNCTIETANWINVGLQTSVKLDLEFGETYEWQVRAVNPVFTTYADGGKWTFSTTSELFKSKPVDGAIENSKVDLIWQKLGLSTYEYCLTMNLPELTEECDTSWIDAGTSTSIPVSGLKMNKTYYWQVRATNNSGVTIYADEENWWSFKVKTPTTGVSFTKVSPEDGDVLSQTDLVLEWSTAYKAKSYEYCISPVNDTCTWINVGLDTLVNLNLESGEYKWQVRAKVKNSYVYADADESDYWNFSIILE